MAAVPLESLLGYNICSQFKASRLWALEEILLDYSRVMLI